MARWLEVLLVLMTVAVTLRGQPGPGVMHAGAQEAVEKLRKQYNLPALAVVVVKDGQICDRGATGLRKTNAETSITIGDQFHIGSCEKSMTATLAAIFIERGKLRWDTTIGEVFPEWKDTMSASYQKVTVEQLLMHRGGVPHGPPPEAWDRAWRQVGTPTEQRREFVEAVLRAPPEVAPGTEMVYANDGYVIVGAMLEKITGVPFETLMTENLFRPLHMDSAGFGSPGTPDGIDQPWGHSTILGMNVPSQKDNPPVMSPAGRVHCTLDDLARFAICHMEGERAGGLLKPETFRKLHAPPAGGDYACGWKVVKRDWAGGEALNHNGTNTYWYATMWLAPRKDFAVLSAMNIGSGDVFAASDKLAGAMIQKWLLSEKH